MQTTSPQPDAIILAAGKGTRMGGDLPKVVYPVAGRPMIQWVVDACLEAGVGRCIVVVGYQGDKVRQALVDYPACLFVEQKQQLGTGHAPMMARHLFDPQSRSPVFILAGDGPLIRAETLTKILEAHRQSASDATLATAILKDPTGYGRVLRDADHHFDRIVEQKDATPEQLQVCEVNPSYYCFNANVLFEELKHLVPANQQGEYYLTDVPGQLKKKNHPVGLVEAVPPEDVLSINTPEHLAEVDRIMRQRLLQCHEGK